MIEINKYAEFLHDIRGQVNSRIGEGYPAIEGVVISPTLDHLMKRAKDKEGILLCGNFPSSDTDIQNPDSYQSANECLIYLIEKKAEGSQTTGEELEHYAYLQKLIEAVKEIILSGNYGCDLGINIPRRIRTEWEYNLSGFNGLSVGFDLKDYD